MTINKSNKIYEVFIKNYKNTNLSKIRIAVLALCSILPYPYKSHYIVPEIILSI